MGCNHLLRSSRGVDVRDVTTMQLESMTGGIVVAMLMCRGACPAASGQSEPGELGLAGILCARGRSLSEAVSVMSVLRR